MVFWVPPHHVNGEWSLVWTIYPSWGHTVVQLVEALHYNSDGRGFSSLWCHWIFINIILPTALWPGVDSACNRNEYQQYFLGDKSGQYVWLTNLPPSYASCLEIWEPQLLGTLRVSPNLLRDCFTFSFTYPVSSLTHVTQQIWGSQLVSWSPTLHPKWSS